MTVSILEILSTLPSGKTSEPLAFDELSSYLAKHLGTEAESVRNKRHALRDELYRDGGTEDMKRRIDEWFKDPLVRSLRKAFVEIGGFNNALKRTVNELSTVYAEPAKRAVKQGNENYQTVLTAVQMDLQSLQLGRLLNLHRQLLVGFRVRKKPDGTREPVIDIATPANVRCITHPNDDSYVIGWLIRVEYKSARASIDVPAWTLWTDHESIQLRRDLSVVTGSYEEHNLGVCPWVPVSLGPPQPGFWSGCEGEDMVRGHIAIWFQNILNLKETKSATKLQVLKGDGTSMARGQASDSEAPVELTDGQSISMEDAGMDTQPFRDNADHILEHLAQNYGMSAALINHESATSAESRELMRIPLKELRRQQQIPLRKFERDLAVVMAAILAVDLPSLGFNVDGWTITFGDDQTPLNPTDAQVLYQLRKANGLTNVIEQWLADHPGATFEQAIRAIEDNYLVSEWQAHLQRPISAADGSLGGAMANPGNSGAPGPAMGNPATDSKMAIGINGKPTVLTPSIKVGEVSQAGTPDSPVGGFPDAPSIGGY